MKERGFTLVELAVAIAVIGILATIVIVSHSATEERSSVSAIDADLKQALQKATTFRSETGTYPESNEDVTSLKLTPNKSAYHHEGQNYAICSGDRSFGVIGISRGGDHYAQTTTSDFGPFSGSGNLSSMCANLLSDSSTILYSAWARSSSGDWTNLVR